jgi:hypothetical protein
MGHVLDIVYVGTRYITYLRSFLHSFIMVRNNIEIKNRIESERIKTQYV